MKTAQIVLLLMLLWLGAILLNTYILVPPIYAVKYVGGVACFSWTSDTIIRPACYTFTATWMTFGGVIPVLINIVVLVLCYIKRKRVSGSSDYNVRLTKFALFLLSGSFNNILGQNAVSVIAYYFDAKAVCMACAIASLSLSYPPHYSSLHT